MPDVFTMCISSDAGRIILNGYERLLSSKPESHITCVPLDLSYPPSFYYVLLVGDLNMDGTALQLTDFSWAIVDSGTTWIVFSKATLRKLIDLPMKNFVPSLAFPMTTPGSRLRIAPDSRTVTCSRSLL